MSLYVRASRPFTYFIGGSRTAPGYASFARQPYSQTLSVCVAEKIEITQSGAAYEKYGAKGLNDVCIAAISLILRGADSSFACRCLSYPNRKLQIYHGPDRALCLHFMSGQKVSKICIFRHTKNVINNAWGRGRVESKTNVQSFSVFWGGAEGKFDLPQSEIEWWGKW